MGYLQASEMANSGIPLRAQLHWHLTANCYPPVPAYMVDVAESAITLANAGKWDEPIELPEGVLWRLERNYCTAREAVESLNLDAWIRDDDDDWEGDGDEDE